MNPDPLRALLDELAETIAQRAAAIVLEGGASDGNVARESWRLLTLEEAAARLGRSPRWVRDRVKAGELVRVRLDAGAFAFELEDVQEFARARRLPSISTSPGRLVDIRGRR
jgi:hypothetical protein